MKCKALTLPTIAINILSKQLRNSRHTANLSCGVFVYYNLAIKHTVCNSVIWSGADVLMLVYFLFLHFRLKENSSSMFEYWSFVFWILVKTCGKNCRRTCYCSFQKFFFNKFIYNSILSTIFFKMRYDIECSIFRKKNSCDETFPLSIVNNPL